MSAIAVEVTESTFERDVVARSHEEPVVVDFWADWCGPCRVLGPVLERLAAEADGAWTLAKVDVDVNPGLAERFRVQGIPAVHAFKDGQRVAEFVGALPEARVREWLAQLGPSPADLEVGRGEDAEARGDLEGATGHYRAALDLEPAHPRARSQLQRVELALRSATIDEDELRARLERDPGDLDAAIGLADVAAARGELDAAFERLLEVVRASSGEQRDAARRHLLALLDTIPADDPRAIAARRSLSLALY